MSSQYSLRLYFCVVFSIVCVMSLCVLHIFCMSMAALSILMSTSLLIWYDGIDDTLVTSVPPDMRYIFSSAFIYFDVLVDLDASLVNSFCNLDVLLSLCIIYFLQCL